MTRFLFLDGLRGWACVAVVILHTTKDGASRGIVERMLGIFYDGSFSVLLFFTISGFALASITEPDRVLRAVIARLPRLWLPTFVVLQLGWLIDSRVIKDFFLYPFLLLTQSFLMSPRPAPFLPEKDMHSWWLLTRFGQMWTMMPEIHGSLFVFFWTLVRHRIRFEWAALAGITVLFIISDYLVAFFILGFVFHTFWKLGSRNDIGLLSLAASVLAFYAPILIVSICPMPIECEELINQLFSVLRICFIFLAVRECEFVRRFLECRLSVFLGNISFSVYLCHNVVQCSLFDYAYARPTLVLERYAHASLTLTLSILFGAAFTPFERFLNRRIKDGVNYMLLPHFEGQRTESSALQQLSDPAGALVSV